MKIAVLDWYTVTNNGDIPVSLIEELGDARVFSLTPPEKTVENIGDAEIVLCNKVLITPEVMDACPNIKYIGLFATGFNNVDVAYAAKKGITVCNAGTCCLKLCLQSIESIFYLRVLVIWRLCFIDGNAMNLYFTHGKDVTVGSVSNGLHDLEAQSTC